MNKSMQSTALSVIGVISVVAAIGGLYLNFVKPVMRWPIIVAALVLIAVAVIGLIGHERVRGRREADPVAPYESMDSVHDNDGEVQAHDHGRGPRIGWLLIVPFLLLGVVTPGPLGAFSAERDSGRIATNGEAPLFDPIDGGEDGVELAVGEYSMRALYDDPKNLEGKTFSLTGFASTLTDGEGWALTRMSLNCCAGDAQAIKVRVVGSPAPANNEWVTLTGKWKQSSTPADDPATLPVIEVDDLQQIAAPANPYE
ncbi:TIGR03943 family protein [Knoellia sp. S7-12]|uniref:TIGR03943 family putative permease subunit n=1 Tax=Knoellia sp. S7-12 TaxID=3126698 RepID=UPI003365D2AA